MSDPCQYTKRHATVLAPGRNGDMRMLHERLAQSEPGSNIHRLTRRKIDDLLEEGKCDFIWSQRSRLVKAALANDSEEILNISEFIREHVKREHRRRFERGWLQKG